MIRISQPQITETDIQAVSNVLRSGLLVQGPQVQQLETEFANYCDCKHAIAVNSGTAALHCALFALNIAEDDEIITSPFTFVASANSILMQNAKVKFVDIDPHTFNIDPEKIATAINPNTKAILPISLYGLPYDQSINQIAVQNNLKVIDDACQSVGAMVGDQKSGSFADITAFSLYATKNIMSAEGGIITTNNDEYAKKCRRFRHHGQSQHIKYQYHHLGYNYRLTDIHAAIGINQLQQIETFNSKRIQNAEKLTQALQGIAGVITPKVPQNTRHVFHQYTIRLTKDFPLTRDQLKSHLLKNEIESAIYYPKPLHLHPHFREMGYNEGDFPIAEQISKEVLSLPVHPALTGQEIEKIILIIQNAASKNPRSHQELNKKETQLTPNT